MNLRQLDDLLNSWKHRLSMVAENLLQLQSDTTYQSLTGTGGLDEVKVSGATAARLGNALQQLNELFVQFGLLQATVDRADKLRQGMPSFFGSETRVRAIEHLLLSASIELSTDAELLPQRHLLSGGPKTARCAPEELLAVMSATFAQVRDAVSAVGAAWIEFGRCTEKIDAEIDEMRSQDLLPSQLLDVLLQPAHMHLAASRQQAQRDPIGAMHRVNDQVLSAIGAVRRKIQLAEQVQAQWRSAQTQWIALEKTHEGAVARSSELRGTILTASSGSQVADDRLVHGLRDWLNRLDRRRDQGALEAVAIGLRNWASAAQAILVQDEGAMEFLNAQLALRDELRGRLQALSAKASVKGLTDHPEIAGPRDEAEATMYTRPTDLERAAQAMELFEERLRKASTAPMRYAGSA